tara:strand:- start:244 stop:402 length:159 start_codon:yes stop_codon:yes gene_type:complete
MNEGTHFGQDVFNGGLRLIKNLLGCVVLSGFGFWVLGGVVGGFVFFVAREDC